MAEQEQKLAWYYNPVTILILLFGAIGPFALPLLYKSPAFKKETKIILTIAVIIFTIIIIYLSYKATIQVSKQLEEIDRLLKHLKK